MNTDTLPALLKKHMPKLCLLALLHPATLLAHSTLPQTDTLPTSKADTTIQKALPKEKKLSFSGMAILRYTASLNKQVDINGKHYAGDAKHATNAFAVRRVRVLTKARLTPKAEAAVLLNLTDFIGDPKNKVLETATLKYRFNDHFNIQAGQFRPYFGREDLYPEEQLRSLEWSNQYYAFGANGWQSFQVGATVYGKASLKDIPLRYYVGVFNGNGRNQLSDNDNGKLFPARLEFTVLPQAVLGFNGGIGKEEGRRVWAAGADIDYIAPLADRWQLELQSEYKCGTNHTLFHTAVAEGKNNSDYLMQGFYFLPHLQYTFNKQAGHSAELSMRYESLDTDFKGAGNKQVTCIPMAGVQTGGNLTLRAGMLVNHFGQDIPNTSQYSHTRFVCQAIARL